MYFTKGKQRAFELLMQHNRRYIGIELNPDYCELAKQRIGGDED